MLLIQQLLKDVAIPNHSQLFLCLQAVEVLWTPQNENDTISEQELLEDYPLLRPLQDLIPYCVVTSCLCKIKNVYINISLYLFTLFIILQQRGIVIYCERLLFLGITLCITKFFFVFFVSTTRPSSVTFSRLSFLPPAISL